MPKKRGPKTDVLEALLKRVDGLEQKLKENKKPEPSTPTSETGPQIPEDVSTASAPTSTTTADVEQKPAVVDTAGAAEVATDPAMYSPSPVRCVEDPLAKGWYGVQS